MENELLSLLRYELGEVIDWEELCLGVYFLCVQPNTDSAYPCSEYYLVLPDAPITREARALGRLLEGIPGLLYAIDPPDEGGWTAILYELCKNQFRHGSPAFKSWSLSDAAMEGMELCPAYFGSFPVPPYTPWGWTFRHKVLDNGVYWLETSQRTQAMCSAILAQVKGYQYCMFSAGDAALDPSAELGDGATAGGLYSVISRLDDDGNGWSYFGTTYIDGSKLMTGTVKATSLQGGSVSLLDAYGSSCGVITLTLAASSSYAVDISSYSAMRMAANSGDLYMSAYNYYYLWISSSVVSVNAPFFSRNVSSLGTSGYPWSDVYANNATIQTSDLNVKKDVRYGLDDYDALFDALRPMSFLFTNGESGRRHLGLGAQDVEAAMDKLGVSSMDFAGFIKSKREEGSAYNYALRYGEFIPLCIEQIQKLKARVAELEGRIL